MLGSVLHREYSRLIYRESHLNFLPKYNVINAAHTVIGTVRAPSGDIAHTLAVSQFPTERRIYVLLHSSELLYLRHVYSAVLGKDLTALTPNK